MEALLSASAITHHISDGDVTRVLIMNDGVVNTSWAGEPHGEVV